RPLSEAIFFAPSEGPFNRTRAPNLRGRLDLNSGDDTAWPGEVFFPSGIKDPPASSVADVTSRMGCAQGRASLGQNKPKTTVVASVVFSKSLDRLRLTPAAEMAYLPTKALGVSAYFPSMTTFTWSPRNTYPTPAARQIASSASIGSASRSRTVTGSSPEPESTRERPDFALNSSSTSFSGRSLASSV